MDENDNRIDWLEIVLLGVFGVSCIGASIALVLFLTAIL